MQALDAESKEGRGASGPVLVVYATKNGSTAAIAEEIGEELRRLSLDAEVHPVDAVQGIERFGAVVLGSAIYMSKWRKEAVRFGTRHAAELRTRPVWLFESGPLDTSADQGTNKSVETAQDLAREIGARGYVTFGGRLLEEDAGAFTRRLMATGNVGSYGDFRNFGRIREWARKIAAELRPAELVEVC